MPPTWPPLPADHPLLSFASRLPLLLDTAGHNRLWGLTLSAPPAASPDAPASQPDFQTLLVLQKYLRSTQGDLDKAAAALGESLRWRRDFFGSSDYEGPEGKGKVAEDARDPRFEGLGRVTKLRFEGEEEVVCTWNIYGAAKGNLKGVFGDLDKFLHWRVTLMERSIAATLAPVLEGRDDAASIPDYGEGADPYQGYQVHDYMDISFLRMDPDVKAASGKTIELMGKHYPEWLSRKFFVSVPLLMSWVFQAVRLVISAETARKFTVVSYKANLAAELDGAAGSKLGKVDRASVPKEYGGTGEGLKAIEVV
ncbi:hypothetical protein JCM10207_007730 [Rhodosporidiobolus poonsookiae]